jgi:hypothetical protein
MTFVRPSNWQRWQPNDHDPMTSGPLLYLSTDPLLPDCAVGPDEPPNPPDANGFACQWPLGELEAGGVLVTAYTSRLMEPMPTEGQPITINGEAAHLVVETPGACGEVGADVTVYAAVPMGQRQPVSNIAMIVCLRAPTLELTRSQAEAFLETVLLVTPEP